MKTHNSRYTIQIYNTGISIRWLMYVCPNIYYVLLTYILSGRDSTNAFIHRFIVNFAAVFWCCASTFRSAFFIFAEGLEARGIYSLFKRIWKVTLDSGHTLSALYAWLKNDCDSIFNINNNDLSASCASTLGRHPNVAPNVAYIRIYIKLDILIDR